MPRAKTKYEPFEFELIKIGKKCGSDNDQYVFPMKIAEQLAGSIAMGKKYTVEEVSPVERQLKKKQVFESWDEHAMADVLSARLSHPTPDQNSLMITCQPRSNKFGKLLMSTIESATLEGIEFYPVGIGDVDENGEVKDYTLSYIAMEAKHR